MSELTFKDIGEFGLIEFIKSKSIYNDGSVAIPVGDDAALIDKFKDRRILVTTDLLLEGVDLELDYFTPSEIAHKALASNISDLSAMGGIPNWFTLSLGVPESTSVDFLQSFYEKLLIISNENRIALIGGDFSQADKLIVSITLIGSVERGDAIRRNGACPGDSIWLTGGVGFSSLGLFFLRNQVGIEQFNKTDNEFIRYCIQKHKKPPIRTGIGSTLASEYLASSMIDISDGLFKDLSHVCRMSKVGSHLDLRKLPGIEKIREITDYFKLDLNSILSGGEDFELLFTVAPAVAKKITKRSKDCRFFPIGQIQKRGFGLKLVKKTARKKVVKLLDKSFQHF